MNYSKWKDDEVIKLFKFIEDGKSKNIPLTKLFSAYASQTKRMPNSVRNYYYAELKYLEKDNLRAKRLNINLALHQKTDQKEFSLLETEELVTKILGATSKGRSVRKACLTLANGDINKMVRYQNKFRTVMQKDKELYSKCLKKLNLQNTTNQKVLPDNVITIKQHKPILTDSDINSLFLGLVKLVKKQAGEEVNKMLKLENQKANDMLRRALVELSEKETQLKNLRQNFKVLSSQNQKLNEEIKLLRGKNAELKKLKNSTV